MPKIDACKPVNFWKSSNNLELQHGDLQPTAPAAICKCQPFRSGSPETNLVFSEPEITVVLKYIDLRPFRRSSCKALRSPPKKVVAVVFSCFGKVWKYLVEVILSMICTMTDTSDEKMWSCHFVTAEAFCFALANTVLFRDVVYLLSTLDTKCTGFWFSFASKQHHWLSPSVSVEGSSWRSAKPQILNTETPGGNHLCFRSWERSDWPSNCPAPPTRL